MASRPLTRPAIQLAVDVAAFAGFVLLTSTGILLRTLLPPGSGRRTTIFGFDRHAWGEAHFWIAMVFFAVLVVHLWLHRRWIATMLRGRPEPGSALRIALGLVGLLAIFAAALAPFVAGVEEAPRRGEHGGTGSRKAAPAADDQDQAAERR